MLSGVKLQYVFHLVVLYECTKLQVFNLNHFWKNLDEAEEP